jgi:hypothetical protein
MLLGYFRVLYVVMVGLAALTIFYVFHDAGCIRKAEAANRENRIG